MKRSRCISALCLACLTAFMPWSADVQGQTAGRWAVRYTADLFDTPFFTYNPRHIAPGRAHEACSFIVEYRPKDKWGFHAGYFLTDLSYGLGGRHMEGLRAGARRYFLPSELILQPYASLSAELNWAQRRQYWTDGSTACHNVLNPRLSFVPALGLELYIFTSIALFAEYNLGIGVASRTVMASLRNEPAYVLRDRGMYHAMSIGVKVTFPFTFTSDDGDTLLYIATELIWELLDWRHHSDNHKP
jgi:hypothetical protein